ncbi:MULTISPECIES: hypothetical protein [unclassified Cyanobium]|uniref:hypothetical protein n=1 Tax=unclassified Cyanobium TaxID=2627006 RepID=UPI0020CB9E7E|nr:MULTISPECIES: hypothetical protein [unclassified Cyanobium]
MTRPLTGLGTLKSVPSPRIRTKALIGAAVVTAFASVLSAGSANAAAHITTCADAKDLTFGDKTVSGIVCTDVGGLTEIRLGSFGVTYDLGSTIDPPTQKGSIAYTISIIEPGFEFARVGLDSGCINPLVGGCTVTKNFTWTSGSDSLVSINGFPAPIEFEFAAGVTLLKVEDIFSAKDDSAISTVNNFFAQRPAPTPGEPVPGPLPILGAGMAFGFSRRLRSRIKSSATMA